MVARTLSYESCEFDLVDGIGSDDVTQVYNKASQLWGDLHSQLGERTRKMASNARVEENVKRCSDKGIPVTQDMRYHMDLVRDSDSEPDEDSADEEERKFRRKCRNRAPKQLTSLFWSAHQRFFRSLCIATKVPKAIELAKESLENDKCVVIGLQSTGEARAKGATKAAGVRYRMFYDLHFDI